jgi:hypothetical protein
MKVLKNFNNISQELRDECIPPFSAGEIKTFRMLNGVVNNDPDITERLKQPVFYPDAQIRTWDRIKDPFAKKDKDGNWISGFVDIGVVETFDIATERPTKYKLLVKGQGIGVFVLSGDSIEDVELYEFLCISNENSKFKYRDKKTIALFEEVEEVDANTKEEEDFDLMVTARTALKKLNADQKRQLSILLHVDPSLTDKQLSVAFNEYAKAQPNDLIENIKHLKNSGKKGVSNKRMELA